MISCTLGDKTYTVDFVSGRVLREMHPAWEALNTLLASGQRTDVTAAEYQSIMDRMVKWFCLLFGNQFTPMEFYENYPADSMVGDITTAIMAVHQQTTEVLHEFPRKPAAVNR